MLLFEFDQVSTRSIGAEDSEPFEESSDLNESQLPNKMAKYEFFC